jgi:hypothetical protein
MLCGLDVSGFGWDNVRKCVVAEDAVWQAYVQVNLYHVVIDIFILLLYAYYINWTSSYLMVL